MSKKDRRSKSEKKRDKRRREQRQKENKNTLSLKNLNLPEISPITANQVEAFNNFYDGKNLALVGSAGSGKSFIAMYLALDLIINEPKEGIKKLYIVRSAVACRDIGHLPGTEEEKMAVYETPYKNIVRDLFDDSTIYDKMKDKNHIEFNGTSFLQGITIDNAVILVDECENMNMNELNNIITRMGDNCYIIFAGDTKQDFLTGKKRNDNSGLSKFLDILNLLEDEFSVIEFTTEDIVRSGLVKKYLIAKEKIEKLIDTPVSF